MPNNSIISSYISAMVFSFNFANSLKSMAWPILSLASWGHIPTMHAREVVHSHGVQANKRKTGFT